MSEYWKSTPKYWCKHCKTYVRDTKLERTNHDATPKHQGNLKRFLRDLHRGHEQGEKDKERAKAEVARLNGMGIAGGSASASSSSSGLGRGPTPAAPKPQATAADRKRQLQQLAELGVSIPDEFRPDMAMAGEWQVTSRRIIEEGDEEKKPDAIALGVRKRQVEEEEEEEAVEARKRRWGQTHRTYPSEKGEGDLDALLSNVTRKGKELATKTEADTEVKTEVKTETATEALPSSNTEVKGEEQLPTAIKREAPDGDNATAAIPPDVKQEGEEPVTAGIVFKKRKAKNIRQK